MQWLITKSTKKGLSKILMKLFSISLFILLYYTQDSFAQDSSIESLNYTINNIFLLLCAVLVLFMQSGFALVSSGLNSAKNTVNLFFKNILDASIGIPLFFVLGFGLMYPGSEYAGDFFGFAGFFVSETLKETGVSLGKEVLNPQVDFLFQAAFAATAATIVSGSLAGRLKFWVYWVYSAVMTALIYPISGMWKWGGGFLDAWGFQDFAGSSVVHALGGFAALAGAIVLGSRINKFDRQGKARILPGHNLAFAGLGTFILWIGWYGFNPGSLLSFSGEIQIDSLMRIALNTTLAGTTGLVTVALLTWILYKKPEFSMSLNGLLGGLVAITANCDVVSNLEAILIGFIAGIFVILAVKLLDRLKIDDPIGAWAVHGLNGVWGTIAVGIFSEASLGIQVAGTLIISAWGFGTMFCLFWVLKKLFGIRVSRDEELKGLDVGEHGEEAYKDFQVFIVD